MKFENTFAVKAPVDEVWKALLDIERVAPCMPGAEVLERVGDNTYKVGIKVKVGPISMLYRGQVEIVERDDQARRATMRAKAKEARGQGTADANIRMSLVEQSDTTQGTMETEIQLSGKAAAMGRGVIADVSEKLVSTFAANLAEMLEYKPAPAPAASTDEAAPAPASAQAPTAEPAAPTEQAGAAPPPTTGPPPGGPGPSRGAGAAPSSLPVGAIAASVIAKRLSNPRVLLVATASLALVFGAIGFAIGKSRRGR